MVHSGILCPHHYLLHLSLGLGASEPSYPRYLLEDFSRNLPLPLLESYPLHWDIFAAEIKVSANTNEPNHQNKMNEFERNNISDQYDFKIYILV